MHRRIHTTVLLVIILAVMSGLYIFHRLAGPTPVEIPSAPVASNPFADKTPQEILRGDTSKKQIIFTFDAGSGDASVQPILQTLAAHGVKGTFFMTGVWAIRNPALTRAITAAGHEVFNHSYNHPHLTELSDQDIVTELTHADVALASVTGSSTKPYFRPPYGDRDQRVLDAAAQTGYRSVYWTLDARDWMESEGMTANTVKEIILSNLEPGMIILMHVGDTITGEILDDLFTEIKNRGYEPVALTQGM
ncbi:MAG: polysaccharide deacetylase family protein [Patescibacteria group bacterium]